MNPMKKRLLHIVSLLLIPCLLLDSVSASGMRAGFGPASPSVHGSGQATRFNEEAVTPEGEVFPHCLEELNRFPTVRVDRKLTAAYLRRVVLGFKDNLQLWVAHWTSALAVFTPLLPAVLEFLRHGQTSGFILLMKGIITHEDSAHGRKFGIRWPWTLPGIRGNLQMRLTSLKQALPSEAIKQHLKKLREIGKLDISDEDIDQMDVALIGDFLQMPEGKRSDDIDIFIVVPGGTRYRGQWRRQKLLPISLVIEGLKPSDIPDQRIAWIVEETGTLVYGSGALLRKFAHPLTKKEKLQFARSLIKDAMEGHFALDLGPPHRERLRLLGAYLVIRSLVSPDRIRAFELAFFKKPIEAWLPEYYSGQDIFISGSEDERMENDNLGLFQGKISAFLKELESETLDDSGTAGPGAVGPWAFLLPYGRRVTFAAAAIVEGGIVGFVAYFFPGWPAVFLASMVIAAAHIFLGILQPDDKGIWRKVTPWEIGRSRIVSFRKKGSEKIHYEVLGGGLRFNKTFAKEGFKWLFYSIFFASTSLLGFIPASHSFSLGVVLATAILPHLAVNMLVIAVVWKCYPRRLGVGVMARRGVPKGVQDPVSFESALDIFKKLDDISVSDGEQYHCMKLWYRPQSNIWEIELRSPSPSPFHEMIARLLSQLGLPGPQSGRVAFRYYRDTLGSSLHILMDTELEKGYRGRGFYPRVLRQILGTLTDDSTERWHALDELRSLQRLYDALPENWKSPKYPTADALTEAGHAQSKRDTEIVAELRHLVWQAVNVQQRRSTQPLFGDAFLRTVKVVQALSPSSAATLSVVAKKGGGLWVRAVVGKKSLNDDIVMDQETAWLHDYWRSIDITRVSLQLSHPDNEVSMREWEKQFALLYEERLGRRPPIELLYQIRDNVKREVIDTIGADVFLAELRESEHVHLNDAAVLSEFETFLKNYNHIKALQEGWGQFLGDVPVLEETFTTRTFEGRPLSITSPQAYWAASLSRHHGVPMEILLRTLRQWQEERHRIEEDAARRRSAMPVNIDYKEQGERSAKIENDRVHQLQASWRSHLRTLMKSPHRDEDLPVWYRKARILGLLTEPDGSRVHNVLFNFLQSPGSRSSVTDAAQAYRRAAAEVLGDTDYEKLSGEDLQNFRRERRKQALERVRHAMLNERPPAAPNERLESDRTFIKKDIQAALFASEPELTVKKQTGHEDLGIQSAAITSILALLWFRAHPFGAYESHDWSVLVTAGPAILTSIALIANTVYLVRSWGWRAIRALGRIRGPVLPFTTRSAA